MPGEVAVAAPLTEESRRFFWLVTAASLALLLAGLALLAHFDLANTLPFVDEWFFRWEVRQLAGGHGLQLWPDSLPLALPQVLVGAAAWLIRPDPGLLRLILLPVVVAQVAVTAGTARLLGARPAWALIAGLALCLNPVYLAVATGFMSDTIYTLLFSLACYFAVRWIIKNQGIWLFAGFEVLATLQRQHAAALAALLLVYALARRRHLLATMAMPLTLLVVGVVASVVLPVLTGLSTASFASIAGHVILQAPASATTELPALLGLVAAPLTLALLWRPAGETRPRSRWRLVPLAIAVVGLASGLAWTTYLHAGFFAGGGYLNSCGLGPELLQGSKPCLWPSPLFALVEGVAVVAYMVLLVWRSGVWLPARLGAAGSMLALAGLTQLAPALTVGTFDRYYLPLLAPIIPIVAAAIVLPARARRGRVAVLWAATWLVAGLAIYAVGMADYESWQSARDVAAHQAYRLARPDQVDGGWEANGGYAALPAYESHRIDVAKIEDLLRPPAATYMLAFAPASSTLPGVTYDSLAPGRIVIIRRVRGR